MYSCTHLNPTQKYTYFLWTTISSTFDLFLDQFLHAFVRKTWMRWLALKRLTHMVTERRCKESFCSTQNLTVEYGQNMSREFTLSFLATALRIATITKPCFVIVINHKLTIRVAVIMMLHHPVTPSPSEDSLRGQIIWARD